MPSTYKASTYAAASRWLENSAVKYVPNPKSGKSYDRYAKYEKAKTIEESLALGSKPEDLLFDYERGLLSVSGPFRKEPLDLNKVKDWSALTHTDLAISNFTCFVDPKGKPKPVHIVGKIKERLQKARLVRRRLRKLEVAHVYNVENVDDLGENKGCWESGETFARRSVADKEARDILEVVRREGRKVSDYEVLRVLRLWGFRQNETRKNVMREGQTFVLSDTLGVTCDRTGHTLTREESRLYPDFNRFMCRWLMDSLPPELAESFRFTSININKNYAGRMHRDSNNIGPSILKAFGDFKKGKLTYFPEDDKKLKLPELLEQKNASVELDVANGLLLFDGNRAHEVKGFEGERYSLVFFTYGRFWRLPAAQKAKLADYGFRFPTKPTIPKLKSLLQPPKGYAEKGKSAKAKKEEQKAKKARESGKLPKAPFHFWPYAANKKKLSLEKSAAKYWAKRPPRTVHEETEKIDGKPCTTMGTYRKREKPTGWHEGYMRPLGSKLTNNKHLEFKGANNVADAVLALNSGEVQVPRAIEKARYCVTYSNRKDRYYLLWQHGTREQAFKAFGIPIAQRLGRPKAVEQYRRFGT